MITNPKYQTEIDHSMVVAKMLDIGALAYWVNTNGTVSVQLKDGGVFDLGEFTIEVSQSNGTSYTTVFSPEQYRINNGEKVKDLSKVLKFISSKDITPEFDPETNSLKFTIDVELTFRWNNDFPEGFEDTRFSTNLE